MEKPLTKWMGLRFVAVALSLMFGMNTVWAQQLQSLKASQNNTTGLNTGGGESIYDEGIGYHKNEIQFKFQPSLTQTLDNTILSKNANGVVRTGISRIDNLNEKYKVSSFKRIYRPAGKFEERHRKYGLHLWYRVTFENSVDAKLVASDYRALSELSHSEVVQNKKLLGTVTKGNDTGISTIDGDPNDPMFSDQWGYKNTGQTGGTAGADINLVPAWAVQTGDADVIVAIEDQGIDVDHEDLIGNMWVNTGEIAGDGLDNDNNGYVDDVHGYNFGDDQGTITPGFHGAHVAGTVAAETNNGIGVSGVAGGSGSDDGVRLMSCEVFGSVGTTGFDEAYTYAADMGAVISQNSWGYTSEGVFEQSVLDGIDYFIAEAGGTNGEPMDGGLVTYAAGNTASDGEWWPGYYEPTFAVGNMGPDFSRWSTSTYGDWVDIAAPGGQILSTFDQNDYNTISGTSMACPHVSGVAALIISKFKGNITADQVRTRIEATATDISAFTGSTPIGPLVNAFAALADDDGVPPVAITDLATSNEGPVSIDLSWTAPEDLDENGQNPIPAAGYDIRYSTSAITNDTDFENATQISNEPSPKVPGQTETYTVHGLQPSTMYYFAIKSNETFGGISDLSNVVSTSTTAAPEITVSVTDITETYDGAGPFNANFTIGNEGELDLDYEASVMVFDGFEGAISYTNDNDQVDDNLGLFQGSTPTSYTNAMKFVTPTGGFNLSHVMNVIKTGNQEVEIGVDIVAGGANNPDEGSLLTSDTYLRSADGNEPVIFPVEPQSFNEGDVFWIVFHFPGIEEPQAMEITGENHPGVNMLSFNGDWVDLQPLDPRFDGSNYKIFGLDALEWISLSPTSGTIPGVVNNGGNGPGDITVSLDRSMLVDDTYAAAIRITSNDPFEPVVMIPVNVTFTGGIPAITVNTDPVDFGLVASGAEVWVDLPIDNTGLGDLTIDASLDGDADFTIDVDGQMVVPAGEGDDIRVTFAAGDVGSKTATLTLTTNDPNAASVQISILGESVPPPVIVANPADMTFNLFSQQSTDQALNIANDGTGADLGFEVFITGEEIDVLRNIFQGTIPKVKATHNIDYTTPAYVEKIAKSEQFANNSKATQRDGHLNGLEIMFAEDFDSEGGIPNDWTITDNAGSGVVWGLNSEVSGQGNLTNGSGESATIDSDAAGPGIDASSELITPYIPLGGFVNLVLEYEVDYRALSDNFDLDISTDGGSSWTNILAWTADHRGEHVSIALDQYLEGAAGFHLRWNYYNANWAWWAQVDNVVIYGLEFLSVTPGDGLVAAGNNTDLTVTADAGALPGGTHNRSLTIISNDPANPVVVVPVTIEITEIPVIDVDPEVAFGDVYIGQSGEGHINVRNTGPIELVIWNVESDNADFGFHTDDYVAIGDGANQVEPVETDAEGGILAHIEHGENASVLVVYGDFENLSSPYSASHIHMGAAGETGDVKFVLDAHLSEDNLSGEYRPDDNIFVLSEGDIEMLRSNGLYWNLHTDNNPNGELRGQLMPGTVIEPGDNEDLHISFDPSTAGEITGSLTLSHNDPSHENASVISLSGNGVEPPVAVVTPTSLDFTAAFGDETVASQAFNIDNTAGGSVLDYVNEISYGGHSGNRNAHKDHNHSVQNDGVRNCASMDVHLEKMANDPTYKQNRDAIENRFSEIKSSGVHREIAPDGMVRVIPVYVHVLWNTNVAVENISDAQIQSQMDVINLDFRKMNGDFDAVVPEEFKPLGTDYQIRFELAGITRTGSTRASWGTNDDMKRSSQGGVDPITPATHLNMWVCNIGGGILGYAQFPGGDPATDGVVMSPQYFGSSDYDDGSFYLSAPFDLGRTTTHEIGHYIDLYHTFQGGCGGGDLVDDTPAISAPHYGCPSYPTSGCSSTAMTMNYMDYVDDACMAMFTTGQKERTAAIFAEGGARESLGTIGSGAGSGAGNWLSLSSDEGSVNAGESQGVDAMVDLTDLEAGEYHAKVMVHTNDPANPMSDVWVNLTITGQPNMILDPAEGIDFSDTTWAGTWAMGELKVINGTDENPATAPLVIDEMSIGGDFELDGDYEGAVVPRGDTLVVGVKWHPEEAGAHSTVLTIVSNDANNIATVDVTGTAVTGPVVSADMESMLFELEVGGSATQNLVISNDGGADTEFALLIAGGLDDDDENERTIKALDNIINKKTPAVQAKAIDQAILNNPAYQAKLEQSDKGTAAPMNKASQLRDNHKVVVFAEDFEQETGTFPDLWTITNNTGNPIEWGFNSEVSGRGNLTNGSGESATADSDAAGSGSGDVDTELISPVFATAGLEKFVLEYEVDFRVLSDNLDLDITTDGGETWTTILAWDTDHRGEFVSVELDDYIAGAAEFQVRWRYYNGNWSWWAQVDDVVVLADNAILSVNIDEGTIAAGEGQTVEVTATAANLVAGTYYSGIAVFSEDPFNPAFFVPVRVDVDGGTPVIEVTTETEPEDSLMFDDAIVGLMPKHETFNVANTGNGFLIVNALVDNSDFWVVTPNYLALATGENHDPEVTTDASGWLAAHVDHDEDENRTISFWGEFDALSSEYTGSHIHLGAVGETGEVVFALDATLEDGSLAGQFHPDNNTFELSDDNWDLLRSGSLYWNVHSTNNEAGEIRGQLFPGGILEPGEDWDVDVAFSPAAAGDSEGTLTLVNNDETNSEATVKLLGTGFDSPVNISVNPESYDEEVQIGTESSSTLTISNTGTEDLHFSIDVEGVDMGEMRTTNRFKSNTRLPYRPTEGVNTSNSTNSELSKAIGLDVIQTNNDTQRDGHIRMFKDFEGYALGAINGQDGWFSGDPIWEVSDVNPGEGSQHLHAVSNFGSSFALSETVDGGSGDYSSSSMWMNIDDLGEMWEAIPQDPVAGSVITRLRFEPDGGMSILDGSVGDYVDIPDLTYPIGEYFHLGFMTERSSFFTEVFINGELIWSGTGFAGNTENMVVFTNGFSSGDAISVDAITIIDGPLEFGPDSFVYPDVEEGTVAAGETMEVGLTFDATELVNGEYHANIIIESNDPFNPEIVVPATMTVVGGEAQIELDVTSLEFGEHLIGDEAHWPFTVTNTGTADLEITDISITGEDFSTDVDAGILHPGETGVVVVTFEPSVAETIAEVLKVHSNAGNPTIILSGTGVLPPAIIAVSPGHIEKELLNDETASDNITIENSGEGELEYFAMAIPARMGGGNDPDMRTSNVDANQYKGTFKTVAGVQQNGNDPVLRDDHEVDILEELGYDPDEAPVEYLGNGGNGFSAATRFWTEEGFILTHVRNFFRSEDQFVSNYKIKILVGEDINNAQMLTYQMVTDKSINGEYMLIELDNPQAFGPGETFWIAADYEDGFDAPQGVNVNVPGVDGTYFVEAGGGYFPIEDIFPGMAFKQRAIMDGNFEGGSSVGWLELDPINGTVGATSSANLGVTFNPAGVEPGHHAADILIFSNDPVNDVESVRIDLHIGNRGPVADAQIEDQDMDLDSEPFTVDLSTIFSDPDGDHLDLWSTSDNEMVAETDVEEGMLWVWAKGSGTANITVRAADPSGALAQVDFAVTVAPVAGNNAPVLDAEFADQTFEHDEAPRYVDVTANFSDPDGDELTYWASSSNEGIVEVDGAGETILEITPKASGSAEVTVWASDGKGGEVSDTFTVTVNPVAGNNAPELVMPIENQTVELGHVWSHNLEGTFHDPDGDEMHMWASSADETISHAVVEFGYIHVHGNKVGSTTITLTANDGRGGETSTTFDVTVEFTDVNNDPHVANEIGHQDLEVGGSSFTINLMSVFGDADGDMLNYWSSSDNVDKATTHVEGSLLVVAPQQGGTANITVWASDNKGGTDAMTSFSVSVVDNNNSAPTVTAAIDDQVLEPGSNTFVVDLNTVFTDTDADALTYSASTEDVTVADIAIDGSTLTVTSGNVGIVNISVWGDDGNSPAPMDMFQMTVNTAPATTGIADITQGMGFAAEVIDLSAAFSDADGDNLTYSASSDNPSIASVFVDGATLTVTQVAPGATAVAVTATDTRSGSVVASFDVTVEANDDPVVASAIGAQTLRLEEDPFTVDLSTVFSDANSDVLTFSAASNKESVATVSITDGVLTVQQVAAGSAFITVWADDSRGGTVAEDGFALEVTENQKPTLANAIGNSSEEFSIDLNTVFTDADGDAMTFKAESSDASIAGVAISGSNLIVAHVAVGTATISVWANDGNVDSEVHTFEVTVSITTGLADQLLSESLNAFPNPVNDIATIKYELKESTDVSLAVYDLNGKLVKVLVNEKQSAGVHSARFNVSGLSSGVYLYKITAGGISATKRLLKN